MKKSHPLSALALLLLLSVVACKDKTNNNSSTTHDTVPEVVDTVAPVPTEAECGALQPGQFCSRGLDILQLGDSLVWNNNIKASLADATLKDTVFSEVSAAGGDTVSWYVKKMQLPDGAIYMEADFNNEQLLGRIRIETSRYHHTSGLRVGSTGKVLKAYYADAYVIPFTERGVMEVVVPYQTGKVIYHFDQNGIFDAAKHDYSLQDIPDNAKILRIVIM